MLINNSVNLVLSDVYDYDIIACYYNLLDKSGHNTTKIPTEKKERNIKIGLLQRGNRPVARMLGNTTSDALDFYLQLNDFNPDTDVIMRAKDGIITTKPLKKSNGTIELTLKGIISKMIISMDRKSYMAIYTNGTVKVKGLQYRPEDTSFFDMFRNLNFTSGKELSRGIEIIRETILMSDNINWFIRKNDQTYYVYITDVGEITLTSSGLRAIDPTEIDKMVVWNRTVWPFCQSILTHIK